MAAGDTIAGDIKLQHKNVRGDIMELTSGLDSTLLDEDLTGHQYFNNESEKRELAAGDENQPLLQEFDEGESLIISLDASALAEAIDFDLVGSIKLNIVEQSKTDMKKTRKVIKIGNTALTANPTSVVGTYVPFFEYLTPAHKRWWFYGRQHMIAGEAA